MTDASQDTSTHSRRLPPNFVSEEDNEGYCCEFGPHPGAFVREDYQPDPPVFWMGTSFGEASAFESVDRPCGGGGVASPKAAARSLIFRPCLMSSEYNTVVSLE